MEKHEHKEMYTHSQKRFFYDKEFELFRADHPVGIIKNWRK